MYYLENKLMAFCLPWEVFCGDPGREYSVKKNGPGQVISNLERRMFVLTGGQHDIAQYGGPVHVVRLGRGCGIISTTWSSSLGTASA
jgi:hypothetical protein